MEGSQGYFIQRCSNDVKGTPGLGLDDIDSLTGRPSTIANGQQRDWCDICSTAMDCWSLQLWSSNLCYQLQSEYPWAWYIRFASKQHNDTILRYSVTVADLVIKKH